MINTPQQQHPRHSLAGYSVSDDYAFQGWEGVPRTQSGRQKPFVRSLPSDADTHFVPDELAATTLHDHPELFGDDGEGIDKRLRQLSQKSASAEQSIVLHSMPGPFLSGLYVGMLSLVERVRSSTIDLAETVQRTNPNYWFLSTEVRAASGAELGYVGRSR